MRRRRCKCLDVPGRMRGRMRGRIRCRMNGRATRRKGHGCCECHEDCHYDGCHLEDDTTSSWSLLLLSPLTVDVHGIDGIFRGADTNQTNDKNADVMKCDVIW